MTKPPVMLATLLLAAPLAAQAPAPALMPMPSSVTWSGSRLAIDTTFSVAIVDHRDGRLERAVGRALRRLEGRVGLALPREFGREPNATLVVDVKARGFAVPDLDEDESYRLDVGARQAVLHANTVVGAIRGLETLLQLQSADANGFFLAGAEINDVPRFRWRGLLVDVSRHWEPPEVIKRNLDGMAAVKLNVLHWHLSDDQGFRVESKRHPELQRQGSDGLYYSQDEIREIVAYAADRGIRVVPEFDMPGHSAAWFVGYPELASNPGPYQILRRWGVIQSAMDPTRDEVFAFLGDFVAEMSGLFPDRYWHVGGDEVDPRGWNRSAPIQAWMKAHDIADAHALQTYFNGKLFDILTRYHRQPVGWDEILQPGLPQTAVIQSWRGMEGLTQATAQGRAAILSAPYYLDHIKTAAEMYLTDPLPDGLTAAQQALVLGGEACMWAEYITSETIDSRIWPRMAAVAERFWSPARVRDVPDLYRRLEADLAATRRAGAAALHPVGADAGPDRARQRPGRAARVPALRPTARLWWSRHQPVLAAHPADRRGGIPTRSPSGRCWRWRSCRSASMPSTPTSAGCGSSRRSSAPWCRTPRWWPTGCRSRRRSPTSAGSATSSSATIEPVAARRPSGSAMPTR